MHNDAGLDDSVGANNVFAPFELSSVLASYFWGENDYALVCDRRHDHALSLVGQLLSGVDSDERDTFEIPDGQH